MSTMITPEHGFRYGGPEEDYWPCPVCGSQPDGPCYPIECHSQSQRRDTYETLHGPQKNPTTGHEQQYPKCSFDGNKHNDQISALTGKHWCTKCGVPLESAT